MCSLMIREMCIYAFFSVLLKCAVLFFYPFSSKNLKAVILVVFDPEIGMDKICEEKMDNEKVGA